MKRKIQIQKCEVKSVTQIIPKPFIRQLDFSLLDVSIGAKSIKNVNNNNKNFTPKLKSKENPVL